MADKQVLHILFGGFGGSLPTDKKSFQSFRKLARESTHSPIKNTWSKGKSLKKRWKRAKTKIESLDKPPPLAKVQILAYSLGCHLAVKAAILMHGKGYEVDAMFLVVPDPKYRMCELDDGIQVRYRGGMA